MLILKNPFFHPLYPDERADCAALHMSGPRYEIVVDWGGLISAASDLSKATREAADLKLFLKT